MFDALRSIFSRPDATMLSMEPKLAVAALLVHLAAIDGQVTEAERQALESTLMDYYGLNEGEVKKLIVEATRQDQESVDFYRFTSALTSLDNGEKLEIIRMMWQVVFADRRNHELEDNMVWRIAELIGVSARDRTVLRSQMARA
ncbi:MAG: TerB family tellurite resistance protein [Devosia sp.]|uniref:tellurite resistance TerB family protein n=1 Tax=Devosia sp. TaxID=1871048 RepID=UPI001AC93362|nr:TerB family tellurite resistance protein [Devosia sp.]MBN9307752.1 TerB family tellurite resistance protein [Devosia sp.]MBN9314128.1 TerB family tellurite resistance protein [Devosia sp.]